MGASDDLSSRLGAIIAEASEILGVSDVRLICEWNLETVQLFLEDGTLVASDRGATYGYLARNDNQTYVGWDLPLALSLATSCDVELVDVSDEFSVGYVVRRTLQIGEVPVDLAGKVGCAIDQIFECHLRADLRGKNH